MNLGHKIRNAAERLSGRTGAAGGVARPARPRATGAGTGMSHGAGAHLGDRLRNLLRRH